MLRVLVVDDEPAVARSLGRLLAHFGFEVRTCGDGPTALGLLEAAPSDVLLTDLHMPGMGGVALLVESRRRWPQVRRVLMSALAASLTPPTLAPCQPCQLLAKPFTEAALRAAVLGEPE